MANLYKKPVVTVDPKTGKKTKTKSKKWWGQYKDASGRLRRHPLAIDKTAAQAMLNELVPTWNGRRPACWTRPTSSGSGR